MPTFQYKVMPFIGQVGEGDKHGATKVAAQLQKLIDEMTGQGWEFYRIDQVQIAVRPGCLSAFLGGRTNYISFDMVTFRRLSSD